MTSAERYRQLRARGLCVSCGHAPAMAPRVYCEGCQRRRDTQRRQRTGWQGGAWEIRAVPAPEQLRVVLVEVPPEPPPPPRKVVTLRPPHLGRDVEFEVVWP